MYPRGCPTIWDNLAKYLCPSVPLSPKSGGADAAPCPRAGGGRGRHTRDTRAGHTEHGGRRPRRGGLPPRARGAADRGARGGRHRPRARPRARGGMGQPTPAGSKNPNVYTSVKVFGRHAVEIPLPYYLTAADNTNVNSWVYSGKAECMAHFTHVTLQMERQGRGRRRADAGQAVPELLPPGGGSRAGVCPAAAPALPCHLITHP